MMFATIADTLRDVGTVAAALAAIVTATALIGKLPPVRWLWRQLIGDPFAHWFRAQVREELERTNGGSSLMDRITKVEKALLPPDEAR